MSLDTTDIKFIRDSIPYKTIGYRNSDYLVDGTADDVQIQQALTAIANVGGGVVLLNPGSYNLSTFLTISSNTILDARLATLTLIPGVNVPMLKNVGVTANRTVADAVINSTTTLTSATANFTSADIGSTVIIPSGLSSQTLVTTIASINSKTSVVLAKAAGVSSSGNTCAIYRRDSNIVIWGGSWYRGANGGPLGHSLFLRHIDGVIVRDGFYSSSSTLGGFNVCFGDVTNYVAENLRFSSTQVGNDGVHIEGPAKGGFIKNLYGTTGDDLLGITPADYPGSNDTTGDIVDLVVEGLYPQNSLCALKIIGGTSLKVRGITVNGIYGTTTTSGIRIQDDLTGACDLDSVTISNIDVVPSSSSWRAIEITGSAIKNIVFRDLTWRAGYGGSTVILISGTANATCIEIDGFNIENGTSMNIIDITGGTVKNLLIKRVRFTSAAITGSLVLVENAAATIDNIDISDVRAYRTNNGDSIILYVAGTVTTAHLSNIYLNGGGRILQTTNTADPLVVLAENISLDSAYEFATLSSTVDMIVNNMYSNVSQSQLISLVGAGAVVSIRGRGLINPNNKTTFSRDGSQTPRIVHPEMQVDLTTVAKNNGDEAYNTNGTAGGGTIGAGRAISNGSNWKNTYSGNTY